MNQVIRYALRIILLLLCFSVFYYSWLPQPSFRNETYFPHWLIEWTDKYGTLRTGVPFLFMGANVVLLRPKRFTSFVIFFSLFTILLIAEFGQLLLSSRHFDILDILVGCFSICIGILVGKLILKIFKKD